MRSRHVFEVDRLSVLVEPQGPVACIVAEAVLDTDNDPIITSRVRLHPSHLARGAFQEKLCAHHRFVKTTPKPSATKNRRGDELLPCCGGGVGELLATPPDGSVVVEAGGRLVVDGPEVKGVGVPDGVDEEKGVDVVDGSTLSVADDTACLTTMRAPSTRTWLRMAILSMVDCVGFAKRSSGYHGLILCPLLLG